MPLTFMEKTDPPFTLPVSLPQIVFSFYFTRVQGCRGGIFWGTVADTGTHGSGQVTWWMQLPAEGWEWWRGDKMVPELRVQQKVGAICSMISLYGSPRPTQPLCPCAPTLK